VPAIAPSISTTARPPHRILRKRHESARRRRGQHHRARAMDPGTQFDAKQAVAAPHHRRLEARIDATGRTGTSARPWRFTTSRTACAA
jgi:hypothetical protein